MGEQTEWGQTAQYQNTASCHTGAGNALESDTLSWGPTSSTTNCACTLTRYRQAKLPDKDKQKGKSAAGHTTSPLGKGKKRCAHQMVDHRPSLPQATPPLWARQPPTTQMCCCVRAHAMYARGPPAANAVAGHYCSRSLLAAELITMSTVARGQCQPTGGRIYGDLVWTKQAGSQKDAQLQPGGGAMQTGHTY